MRTPTLTHRLLYVKKKLQIAKACRCTAFRYITIMETNITGMFQQTFPIRKCTQYFPLMIANWRSQYPLISTEVLYVQVFILFKRDTFLA